MTPTNKTTPGANDSLKDKAQSAASSAAEEAKVRARDAANTVATEASNYADQAKGAAADEVKGVASALRTAADEMRRGSPQERTFSQIADGLADASDAMRDKDLGEMVGAVTDFAKRNPMVFLGSAALIGFAATRFAKASNHSADAQNAYGTQGSQMDRPQTDDRPRSGSVNVASPAINPSYKGGTV